MENVTTLDIDGSQWEIQDAEARNKIADIEEKQSKIIDTNFIGTATFFAKMKYLGEDSNYIYYNFWWEEQNVYILNNASPFEVIPQNTNTDKILSLNLNMLQRGNPSVIQATQHETGANGSGMLTYIKDIGAETNWLISGMGILRRIK